MRQSAGGVLDWMAAISTRPVDEIQAILPMTAINVGEIALLVGLCRLTLTRHVAPPPESQSAESPTQTA